jgi:protein gp37
MGDKTGIEWADSTWNPITGCDKVSPGCDHCYAETFAERWRGTEGHYFEHGFDVQLRPDKLALPLRWTKPRKVFVNSMSDLFHEKVSDEYIARVFSVMACAERHTFQLLTKRHGRMRSLLNSEAFRELVFKCQALELPGDVMGDYWPLPNVWLGVSAEDQKRADLRIPALLDTPAAVRFISAEPLLGPIDLSRFVEDDGEKFDLPPLSWVIVGGESGPGARPMHPDWARSLRDQCVAAGVPFLFKQWGEWAPNQHPPLRACVCDWYDGREADICRNDPCRKLSKPPYVDDPRAQMQRVGKKRAGRELDGRTWDQYPEAVSA